MNNSKDAIDEFIEVHQILKKTNMSYEAVRAVINKAMTANNLAYILADVINSFIIDCDASLKQFDKCFSYEAKRNYNDMRKHINIARKYSERLIRPMYHCKDTVDLCADSDWWLSFIKLVDDRIGIDQQKTHLLLEFLLNMPDGGSPYKVTLNDFINP